LKRERRRLIRALRRPLRAPPPRCRRFVTTHYATGHRAARGRSISAVSLQLPVAPPSVKTGHIPCTKLLDFRLGPFLSHALRDPSRAGLAANGEAFDLTGRSHLSDILHRRHAIESKRSSRRSATKAAAMERATGPACSQWRRHRAGHKLAPPIQSRSQLRRACDGVGERPLLARS
jgi:hypothetical protein